MIEETIYDYLTGAGITAYMEIPEGGGVLPYIVIERTGGGEENRIRHATVVIQSYAASLHGAARLNEQVKALMDDIGILPEIAACDLNSDYNFSDIEKKHYRYQAVYDLVYYD